MVAGQGTLHISGTIMVSNQATGVGGGVFAVVQNAVLEDCLAFDNQAGSKGGGLAFEQRSGTVSLAHVVVKQNRALTGAGLALTGGVSMDDCTIEKNNAVDSGGGAWFEGGGFAAIAINAGSFTDNTAQNGNGGGLLLQNGDARVVASTFDNNLAVLNPKP